MSSNSKVAAPPATPGNATTEVSVWYRETESLSGQEIEEAASTLSAEERARRDRFRFDHDRRDYTVAHDLLRRALSAYAPGCEPERWQFKSDAMGKPHLLGGSRYEEALQFSLSHTRGFVACAISTARVGIDVERIRQEMEFEDVMERYFSPLEADALRGLDASLRRGRFFELWTLKEAWLKATGCGLSGALDSFSFTWEGPTPRRFLPPPGVRADAWKFALLSPGLETRIALASEGAGTLQLSLHGRGAAGHVSYF